jgi:hypothetical protein
MIVRPGFRSADEEDHELDIDEEVDHLLPLDVGRPGHRVLDDDDDFEDFDDDFDDDFEEEVEDEYHFEETADLVETEFDELDVEPGDEGDL